MHQIELLVRLSVELHNLNAQAQRHHELSLVQWLVLRKILASPAISASSLALLSGIHPSTLTPTLQRLEGAEWIYMLERPSDLRQKMLIVSQKGFKICVNFEKTLRTVLKNLEFKDCDDPIDATRALTVTIAQRLQETKNLG
ncbi:MarR family transcriptional regulator [Oligoflexus tunisiensis]|uniref:MarR family transcriptional regulator n=1 Tax=Oligoflexus tunisiensis TaxID=708132 RepID=UPI001C407A2D|nr:MarR family transcriptional regulator [Oligoflexus tunisiensis]